MVVAFAPIVGLLLGLSSISVRPRDRRRQQGSVICP
jgi:hypothetical protein